MNVKVINKVFKEDKFLENILFRNGIYDVEEFLNLNDEVVENPEQYDNMNEAYTLLMSNINKKIGLVLDPDIDGYTSASVIYEYIKELFPDADIQLFIHSGKQHGLSDEKVFEEILKSNINLLIVPDAGSNDYKQHKELKAKGIDVLILDHHECNKYSKDAIVINNQLSDKIKNKNLSGVGVVYKFIKYCDMVNSDNFADKFIDLVALGNIGDVMSSLQEETRYICIEGIKKENLTNRFMKALINKYTPNEVTMTTIAWNVVPKVNAIIRAGSQQDKLELFDAFINPTKKILFKKNSRTPEKNVNMSTKIVDMSEIIKKKQDTEIKKSVALFENRINNNDKVIVVTLEENELDKSYTGLVANKLMSIYKKPVLLLQKRKDNLYGGSARCPFLFANIDNFRDYIYSSELFILCSGHAGAFGVEIIEENILKFISWINEELKDTKAVDGNAYEVEGVIDADDLSTEFISKVGELSWFWGTDLTEPKFLIKNVKINTDEIVMVFNKTILTFNYNWIQYNKKFCSKVFRESLHVDEGLSKNITLDIIGSFIVEEYKGNKYPKVLIHDVEIK